MCGFSGRLRAAAVAALTSTTLVVAFYLVGSGKKTDLPASATRPSEELAQTLSSVRCPASMSILFRTTATTTYTFRVIRNAIVTVVTNTGMIIVGFPITTIETKDVVATEGKA